MTTARPESRLQQSLDEVTRLLDRHRVLEALTHRQEGPKRDLLESLQHRQNLVELHKGLRAMHPADVAFVLEALPPEDRRTVWDQVDPDRAGLVLMEVSGAVRAWLVERTDREALVSLLSTLDPEDLGYISEEIPPEVLEGASRLLELRDRQAFEATVRFDEGHVGHYMTHEWVAVPETLTVQQAIGELRSRLASAFLP
jgi:magnesium transporter